MSASRHAYGLIGTVLACLCLCACESLTPDKSAPTPIVIAPTTSTLDGYVAMLAVLASQDPVRQSDVFYEVEKNHTLAPTTLNELKYAMALAMPGHPNSDAIKGKRLLEQLLSNPEKVTSTEQSLAITLLHIADQSLKMQAEMRRLAATVDDRSRTQSNSERRFQAQTEELNKLRKALDAAQQKLEAIRDIEKAVSERSTTPVGTRESGNREPATQTQTAPAGR